ncbi:uncharacterized protein LOC144877662 [Branchiostoma floridae x Branchiostoma japonicum]
MLLKVGNVLIVVNINHYSTCGRGAEENGVNNGMAGTVACSGTPLYCVVMPDNLLFTSVRRKFRRVRSRFCVSLAMSEFFGPDFDGTYPTMSIYGGPLYAEFLGPFYANATAGSFSTTPSTAEPVGSHPDLPGWEDKAVQDLQDIWLDPEESLSNKFHSTVERDDVPQIEELARLFVFRAKSSQRWVPYYTALSPTATPCPEPEVKATEAGATPTDQDIRILAREEDEEDDLKDWINGMNDDLDISSMLQEAGCDLLSGADEEDLSAVTSISQLTSGQTPECDRSVLIGCEETQSNQCDTPFEEEDDKSATMDLAATYNSLAEQPMPCLPFESQSPANAPKSSSPATELLLTPVYDDACAHYPSCAEEPPSPKCASVVERDDWVMIAAVATLFVYHAKHSLRHVPYYTCQSPAHTPPATPRLVMDGLSGDEDVQSLARRADEEDIADWVNGMCGTGDQPTPTTLLHQGEDVHSLATKIGKEDTQDFVNETCGDQSTPTKFLQQDKGVHGHAKEIYKEDTQSFVNETCGDKSSTTSLMHQGDDVHRLEKEEQDNLNVTLMCGPSHQMAPAALTVQDADTQAKKGDKEGQGKLIDEKDMHMEAQTDEPKKRRGKWWDLRKKREMATDTTNGTNNEDAKKGRKWWRRASRKESDGKKSSSDNEQRSRWWKIFRKKQSQKKGQGMEDEMTTKDSNTKWWKIGSKQSVGSQADTGMGDNKTGRSVGCCICM